MGTSIIIFYSVLVLLNAGHSMGNVFQTFYTEESAYAKLENLSKSFNYGDWDQQCRELGDGWQPALIGSMAEWKYIRELISNRWISRPFMIGGSTNGAGNRHNIDFLEYLPDSSGTRHVWIDTNICGNLLPSYYYLLRIDRARSSWNSVLCETVGLSFHSDSSLYQKLVSSTPQNRTYWTDKCREIGAGWIPTVINSETEFDFIVEKQKELTNNQSYFVSGSTRTTGNIGFAQYLPYEIGTDIRPVYVSTEINGTNDNENFQLTTADDSSLLHGVLCENDGLSYQSETSYYRRLVQDGRQFAFPYWAERCKDLGAGWAPAIADDPAELDLFYRQRRISTDDRNYWIGGLTYKTIQENRAYFITTWANNRYTEDQITLAERNKDSTTFGILCERAKP